MAADDGNAPETNVAADAHLTEYRIESEQVFRGKLLDVRRDRVRLPEVTRRRAKHNRASRRGADRPAARRCSLSSNVSSLPERAVFTEFPRRQARSRRSPLETAKRELHEEAGYRATTWSTSGASIRSWLLDESIELYLAQD